MQGVLSCLNQKSCLLIYEDKNKEALELNYEIELLLNKLMGQEELIAKQKLISTYLNIILISNSISID